MRPFREVGGLTRDALVGMARKTRAGPPASAPPHAKPLIRRSFAATTKTQGQLLEHRFHFGQGVAQDVKRGAMSGYAELTRAMWRAPPRRRSPKINRIALN
jgi:hypothetical protein